MVFTVRFILVVTLLLTICASVPTAQRRSFRRSISKIDATSPISNDEENTTIPNVAKNSVTIDAPPESKPKTETSSEKYNYTNAPRKIKNRGNAKYFTTTTEKTITITTEKLRRSTQPTSHANTETSSNVIETQLQNNTDKKTQKHVKEISEEEKAESSIVNTNKKVPHGSEKPHKLVQEGSDDFKENIQSSQKLKKPNENDAKINSVVATTEKPDSEPNSNVNNDEKDQDAKEFGKSRGSGVNTTYEEPQVENGDSTDNIQTTKRNENGRALSMNIEKYVSPEFHNNNKNNFYTSAVFPDTKRYMSFSKDFTSPIKSTNSFELNTELTTPKNQFFDSKFQAVKDDVSESLEGIDENFKYGEIENVTEEDTNPSDKFNDSKSEVDYKKFRHLEASESKTRNRIHKDYMAEKGVHLDLVSNYSDTKIIDDDGISDGLNKIPVTGVGVQFKKSLPDMENQESKKVIAENPYEIPIKVVPNKTDADVEISALTNKIETEHVKTTQSVLAANIDPITDASDYEKNPKANAINIFKRGSTKKAEVPPTETTSLKPDENELTNNKLTTARIMPDSELISEGNEIFKNGPKDVRLPETVLLKPDENELVSNKSNAIDYAKNLRGNVFKRGSTKKPDVETIKSELDLAANKSVTTPSLNTNHEANALLSEKLLQVENMKESFTEASFISLEKKAKENENAIYLSEKEEIIEPSVISEEKSLKEFQGTKEKTLNQVTIQKAPAEVTTQHTDVKSNLFSETVLSVTSDVKRKESTKTDHEYFEGGTMIPIMMKVSTATEEQPNEILPIEIVSEKKVLSTTRVSPTTEITTAPNQITEVSFAEGETTELTSVFSISTEITSTTIQADLQEEDFTEDLQVATELTEIFNISYPSTSVTESDESFTSTLPYSTEQFSVDDDNTSYYAVSEDDSTLMYEVTTLGVSNSSLDIGFGDSFILDKAMSQEGAAPKVDSTSTNTIIDLNHSLNDTIKQIEIYGDVPLNTKTTSEIPNNGNGNDEIEDDLNPEDGDDDYVESTNRKLNQTNSNMSDLDGEGEQVTVVKSTTAKTEEANDATIKVLPEDHEEGTTQKAKPTLQTNYTMINLLPNDEEDVETTTIDILGLTDPSDEDNSGKIAAIVISSVGAVCLLLLAGLLIVMRKRQKRFNYGQRCRPVSLDSYSMDNVSICNTVGRRKGVLRASKRSYGNPAFDDPATVSHPLNFFGLTKFAGNLEDIKAEFEEIPQVTTRTNELPEGCEVKNRYANVIPLPETRVFLNYIDGYPNSDYINANYVRGAKGARHYYIACQAPMQNTIDDFWRMVWEQQTKVILMLTNLFESGIEKCADYLPPSEVLDCHRLFGDFQVTLKKREVKDKYIISNLQLKNMVSNCWREITHLWYLEWPDKGVPEEANSIIAFLIEARSYMKSSNGPDNKTKDAAAAADNNESAAFELNPVVVHCSPGTGRTGAVIGCDIAIREFELSRQVDVPKIVYKIRRDRASSVQTKEQYAFIYKVINLYASKLTGGALDSI